MMSCMKDSVSAGPSFLLIYFLQLFVSHKQFYFVIPRGSYDTVDFIADNVPVTWWYDLLNNKQQCNVGSLMGCCHNKSQSKDLCSSFVGVRCLSSGSTVID